MGEHLAEVMARLGNVMHWLGKYQESKACILLSRFLRVLDVETLDQLETMVTSTEGSVRAHPRGEFVPKVNAEKEEE